MSTKSEIVGAVAAASLLLSDGVSSARMAVAAPPSRMSKKRCAMSNISKALRRSGAAAVLVAALGSTTAIADPLGFAAPSNPFGSIFEQMLRDRGDGAYAARPDLRRQSVARRAS